MKKYIKAILSMGFTAAMLASTVNAAPEVVSPSPLLRYYDYKTFNGSTCQPRFGTQAGDFTSGHFGIYNSNNANRWVSCPIMRDLTEKTWGAGFTVYLNNAKNSRCYVYSLDPHGTVIKSQWKNVPADGKQTLSFSLNKSVRMGNYFMYCNLTPKGYVNSYKLKEQYFNLNERTDKDAMWPIFIPTIPPVITK